MSTLLNQRYQPVRQLVRGTDSEVWEAFDTRRRLPVLLKIYLPEALQDWKRIQLIEREARILAQINHIEIPGFVDFFALGPEGQQTLYLVTFWVNGITLDQKLAGGWQPTVDEVLGIASKTLELLVYIHAFNPPLIHRDIKPSNLMLNEWQRVYLVDFGGAQEVLSSQGAGGSTLVGTVGYMAPEQLQGRAVPATDIYGLGATLLQLLSRQTPAEAGSADQLAQLEGLRTVMGEDLLRWLKTLLAPNPDQRYASAEEALKDLDVLQERDFAMRTFFYPQNHKAQIPEILHSLTLTERSEEDQALLAGSLLEGRYEVSALLGAGTHSHVYSGRIRHSGQAIILKELCIERVSEWKNIELFEREMDIQQRLKHPRIPAYIDSFQIQEADRLSWFLITEAVDGETLDQRLERGWRPTDEMVWQIAEQLLEILVYLHSQDPPLVHRDLKPSNVLITPDNAIWLIDFGAVQNRLWAQGGGGSTIIGTFGYMAPEQFSGQAWPQSDLYGLGATLIRLLSRRHPIEIPLEGTGLNFEPFVSCPDFYLAWLAALLQPLHTQRFASAAEALSLLRAAARQAPEADEWLKQHQKQPLAKARTGQRKRLLPSRIRIEQVPGFLSESEALEVSTEGSTVRIQCPEDQTLQERLRELDLLNFFPKEEDNQSRISVWRRRLKDRNGQSQGHGGIILLILGVWSSGVSLILGLTLLPDWSGSLGILKLLLPFSTWGAAGVYIYRHLKKRRALQASGALLPVVYHDYFPDYSGKGPKPKASLLSNACLTLHASGLRLSHKPQDDSLYPEIFDLPWSEITAIELSLWRPDYPHWEQLLTRRFYTLILQTRRPQAAYPNSLWGTGSSPKNHAPPDNLRLYLSEKDAESLGQILTGLQRHYAAGKAD